MYKRQPLQRQVDEALRQAYARVHGHDLLDAAGVQRPDGSGPAADVGLTSDMARLKVRHGGLGFRPQVERSPRSTPSSPSSPLWWEESSHFGAS